MSSDEVRLLSDNDCLWIRADDVEDPSGTLSEYIALPAAEFEAWRRVVEAAVARVLFERGIEGIGMTDSSERERHRWLVRCENAAVDAYLATAPERRGDSAKDGRKEAT